MSEVEAGIPLVPEFQFIRQEAEKLGIRVWLFGGTASGFTHYSKWNLMRKKGLLALQADRFDYDFTNIFRSTQDLDLVVDARPDVAEKFRALLAAKYPHFLGSKENQWEVRTLRHRIGIPGNAGFKEALLEDKDFNDQNTDSNSIGMVEITKSMEPVVRDLRNWNSSVNQFLDDSVAGKIFFFRSPKHFETSRAERGENPEILSVPQTLSPENESMKRRENSSSMQ